MFTIALEMCSVILPLSESRAVQSDLVLVGVNKNENSYPVLQSLAGYIPLSFMLPSLFLIQEFP